MQKQYEWKPEGKRFEDSNELVYDVIGCEIGMFGYNLHVTDERFVVAKLGRYYMWFLFLLIFGTIGAIIGGPCGGLIGIAVGIPIGLKRDGARMVNISEKYSTLSPTALLHKKRANYEVKYDNIEKIVFKDYGGVKPTVMTIFIRRENSKRFKKRYINFEHPLEFEKCFKLLKHILREKIELK